MRKRDRLFDVDQLICRWIPGAVALVTFVSLTACTREWNDELPPSSELALSDGYVYTGNQTYYVNRLITHLHTPYSHDACDKQGLSNGVPNAGCLDDLRRALCKNHIDLAFLTDHTNAMSDFEFDDLLLPRGQDTKIFDGPHPVANKIDGCADGFRPVLAVGFESALMPLGMKHHLGANGEARNLNYSGDTAGDVTQLRNGTDAVVAVPHIEKWSANALANLGVDAIEVYNFHSNMDPKIREKYLNLDPYRASASMLPFIFDPFKKQTPDLAFISFLEWPEHYSTKWDAILGQGVKVAAIGGSDSHQNVMKSKANDGERMESHRRLLRWMSNHYLVASRSLEDTKAAIRAGRGWIVFEALGSPVGMNYFVDIAGERSPVGETVTFNPGATVLHVVKPSLHIFTPQKGTAGTVILRLYKVEVGGARTLVAQTQDVDLSYTVPGTGIYRAVISIVPRHFRWLMDFDSNRSDLEAPWIITNPIYIE